MFELKFAAAVLCFYSLFLGSVKVSPTSLHDSDSFQQHDLLLCEVAALKARGDLENGLRDLDVARDARQLVHVDRLAAHRARVEPLARVVAAILPDEPVLRARACSATGTRSYSEKKTLRPEFHLIQQ